LSFNFILQVVFKDSKNKHQKKKAGKILKITQIKKIKNPEAKRQVSRDGFSSVPISKDKVFELPSVKHWVKRLKKPSLKRTKKKCQVSGNRKKLPSV